MIDNGTVCPNCSAKISEGLIGRNVLCKPVEALLVNEFYGRRSAGYCGKCGPPLIHEAYEKLQEEKINLVVSVSKLSESILVLTLENPPGWQFSCIGPCTAQASTGNGSLLELENSVGSFFGSGSENKHLKIKQAEERLYSQLRKKCIEADCNAILGVKVDYHLVSGEKGALLITASGTMVKVSNMLQIDKIRHDFLENLQAKSERLGYLVTLLSGYRR